MMTFARNTCQNKMIRVTSGHGRGVLFIGHCIALVVNITLYSDTMQGINRRKYITLYIYHYYYLFYFEQCSPK